MEKEDVCNENFYLDLNYLYGANPACYLLSLFEQEDFYAPNAEAIESDSEDVAIVPSKAPPKLEDSLNSWRMFCQKQRLTSSDAPKKETEMIKLSSKK